MGVQPRNTNFGKAIYKVADLHDGIWDQSQDHVVVSFALELKRIQTLRNMDINY